LKWGMKYHQSFVLEVEAIGKGSIEDNNFEEDSRDTVGDRLGMLKGIGLLLGLH